MEALETLTDAVEAIAGLDGDDAEVDLDALATQLQAISERLAGASRNADSQSGPPVAVFDVSGVQDRYALAPIPAPKSTYRYETQYNN